MTPSWNQWAANYIAWGRKRVRRADRLGIERLEDRVTPAAPGGVTVAVGDLDGDRFPDLIAAGGPGLGAVVQAFSGKTGAPLFAGGPFNPYPGEDFTTIGLYVAAGDIDADGKAELFVSPDLGGGARVQVFSLAAGGTLARRANFFGIDDPNFRGGGRIAAADVDGDGRADLVIGAGVGGGPRVATYGGRSLAANGSAPARLFGDFFAFEPTLRDGVYAAAADLTGDGKADLVFGGGPGGGPRVLALDAARLLAGQFDAAKAAPVANYFAFDPAARNGVFVAAGNLDADPAAEVLAAQGVAGGGELFAADPDGRVVTPYARRASGFVEPDTGFRLAVADLDADGVADAVAAAASGPDRTVRAYSGKTGAVLLAVGNPFDPAARIPPLAATPGPAVNAAPSVSDLPDQAAVAGRAGSPVSFTVADAETPAGQLTVEVSTSNPAVLPAAGLVVAGTGAARTLTITPAAGAAGTATVTVTVRDAGGRTATDTLLVTVSREPANSPPTIDPIADRTATVGDPIAPVAVRVADAETPAGQLVVSVSSTNPALLPAAGLVLGGAGADRTLTVTPAAGQTGAGVVTVTVRDAAGATAERVFAVVVNPAVPPGESAPTVSAVSDQLVPVNGTVGPIGFTVADAQTPAGLLEVTVSSSNPALLPAGGLVLGGAGGSRTLTITPAPGQAGTAAVMVMARDAAGLAAVRSFAVTVSAAAPPPNTPPTVDDVPDQSVVLGQPVPPLAVRVGDAQTPAGELTVTVSSSNPALLPAAGLALTGGGADRTLTVTPAAGQTGAGTVLITVRDAGGLVAVDTVTVAVTAPPPAPDTTGPAVAVTGGPAADALVRGNPTYAGSVTDAGSGVALLQAAVDGGGFRDVVVAADGSFQFQTPLALGGSQDGPHAVAFRAFDKAGNPSAVTTRTFALDSAGPTVTFGTAGTLTVSPSAIAVTFSEPPSAAAFAPASYAVTGPSGAVPVTGVSKTTATTATLQFAAPLPDGAYTVALTGAVTDAAGNPAAGTLNTAFTVADPVGIEAVSPADGEELVSPTRETVVRFDGPVDPATVTPDSFYLIANGEKLAGSIRVSPTERFATFFYAAPLPNSTEVRAYVDGDRIVGRGGLKLDADGDDVPGGVGMADFRTAPLTLIPNTVVEGRVFDSHAKAPDGSDVPIAGVRIELLGRPDIFAVTDATGKFELGVQDQNADGVPDGLPAPSFFVHIGGDSGTSAALPAGSKYANLSKPFPSTPGQRLVKPTGVFLPPMADADVVPLSMAADTKVGFGPSVLDPARMAAIFPDLTPEQRAMLNLVSVTFPAGSAQNPDGSPLTLGTVIPVNPDRLPGPLPAGATPSLVVSIQAGDATGFDPVGANVNFAVPAPVTFPNLDGLAPGARDAIWSFDHDRGEWVVVGTATVSADGLRVMSDPGVGILAPGWHFFGPEPFTPPPPPPPPGTCNLEGADRHDTATRADPCGCTDPEGEAQKEEECIERAISKYRWTVVGLGAAAAACAAACPATGPFSILCLSGCTAAFVAAIRVAQISRDQEIQACINDNPCADQPPEVRLAQARQLLRATEDILSVSDDSVYREMIGYLMTINDLLAPFHANPGATPDAVAAQANATAATLRSQVAAGAVGQLNQVTAAIETAALGPTGEWDQLTQVPGYAVPYVAQLTGADGAMLQTRGVTTADGQFSVIVPRTARLDSVQFYDHKAGTVGTAIPYLRAGTEYRLHHPTYIPVAGLPDLDADGLVDPAETVIGTSLLSADTDADGLSDRVELDQGLDPLGGRAFPNGVIASLALRGEAQSVTVVGSTADPTRQTAFVATGSHGLAVVDASNFQRPTVLGQLDLDGTAADVAVDPVTNVAVVAAGTGGLHFVSVADPMLPRLVRTARVEATQVEVLNGLAYATVGGRIFTFDTASGEVLTSFSTGDTAKVTGFARDGDTLYTFDADRTLRAFTVSGLDLTARDSVDLPQGAGTVSVSGGVAYIGVQNAILTGGFVTVNVANPDNLFLISTSDVVDPFIAPGVAVVPNGSGQALAVGRVGQQANQPVVAVVDVTDPGNTKNYLTQFPLSAVPVGAALASGIGYVAAGTGGLQVVNYLPFDNQGRAPTVTVSAPNTPTLDEGSRVRVGAAVTDDVQVRNVELLLDGRVVANSVSAPFDLSAVLPTLASGATTVTLQVRATDTGGNAALSKAFTYTLSKDSTPPRLLAGTPADNGAGFRVEAVTFRFSEPIDGAALSPAAFTALNLGADNKVGGGDDTPVPVAGIEVQPGNRVVVRFAGPLPEGQYRVAAAAGALRDLAGNAVAAGVGTAFTSLDLDLANAVVWTSPAGGDWHDPLNWSTGAVPTAKDNVVIDVRAADITVTVSKAAAARSVFTREDLAVTGAGASLTVTAASAAEARFDLHAGASLTATGAGAVFAANGVTDIDGGSLFAINGGRLALPTVTGFTNTAQDVTWRATGAGSGIDLSGVTAVTNGDDGQDSIFVEALVGGRIDLRAATQVVDQAAGDTRSRVVRFTADGANSTIDLTRLTSFSDVSSNDDFNRGRTFSALTARTNGTILAPALTSADGVQITLDGTGTLPVAQLTAFTDGVLSVSGGGHTFAGLTNAAGTAVGVSGGSAAFPALAKLTNGSVTLSNGGTASVPVLSNISGTSLVVSGGVTLSLPAATGGFLNTAQDVTWRATGAGSRIDLSKLASITNGTDGQDSVFVEALVGGKVDLRGVAQVVDQNAGDTRSRVVRFTATGPGSTIDLTALTDFVDVSSNDDFNRGRTFSTLTAASGGSIAAPAVATLDGVQIVLDGSGALPFAQIRTFTDGRLDLTGGGRTFTALENAAGTAVVVDGGTAAFPALTKLPNGTVTVRGGGTASVPVLADINGTSLTVRDGVTLSLPGVTTFLNTAQDVTWRATGAGSGIDLSRLTSITNGTNGQDSVFVEALVGGRVDLRAVTQVVDQNTGDTRSRVVRFTADGVNSTIDLSALANFTDVTSNDDFNRGRTFSTLAATAGGSIAAGSLTAADGVQLTLDGSGTIPFAQIRTFTDGRLDLTGGGRTFTALENAAGTGVTVGGGSAAFPALTTLQNGSFTLQNGATAGVPVLANINGVSLIVSGGVTLSLPAVTSFTNTAQDVTWRATGAGSVLDLRNLTSVTNGDNPVDSVFVEALVGGAIDLRAVAQVVDQNVGDTRSRVVRFTADGANSTIDLTGLVSFADVTANDDFNRGRSFSTLTARNGGTLVAPAVTTLDGVQIVRDGSGTLPVAQIQTFTDGSLVLSGGAYAFTGLTNAAGTGVSVDGGSVSVPALATLQNGSLTLLNGGTASAPLLSNINGASLLVSGGVTLALPSVTNFVNTAQDVTWRATGAGSGIDLRNLTSVTNGDNPVDSVFVEALVGGAIDLRAVAQVVDQNVGDTRSRVVRFTADGVGSLIDLSALANFTDANINDDFNRGRGRSTLTARSLGRITLRPSPLTTFVTNVAVLEETGGVITGLITLGPGSTRTP